MVHREVGVAIKNVIQVGFLKNKHWLKNIQGSMEVRNKTHSHVQLFIISDSKMLRTKTEGNIKKEVLSMEYNVTVLPESAYEFSYRCPNCRTKRNYYSTNKFRVNANKHKIDIWLIYKCENCDSTKNLTLVERTNPENIDPILYDKFLQNNEELALKYGTDRRVFFQNNLSIIQSTKYRIEGDEIKSDIFPAGTIINVKNPYGLKIQPHKLIASVIGVSNTKLAKRLDNGDITCETTDSNLTVSINVDFSIL